MKKVEREKRSERAFSIIEMLVGVVVIGVAIAGLTEVLWINGLFTIRQFNKVDNIAGANHFLELLGKDVRCAVGIGSRILPAFDGFNGTELSNSALVIQIPHITPTHTAGQFPILVGDRQEYDTVVYQTPETSPPYTITRTLYPDPSVGGATVGPVVVLNGVIGPSSGQLLRIFDYEQDNGTLVAPSTYPFSGPNFELMSSISSIVVNIDLRCSNSSNPALANNAATLGIRRQYFMRNRVALSN